VNVSFLSSFEKDLRKIRDQKVRNSVKESIVNLENTDDITGIRGVKNSKQGPIVTVSGWVIIVSG
jgi:DNA replicative helicase MCM subunit Mcm2 (Cdc46/Mcm family)